MLLKTSFNFCWVQTTDVHNIKHLRMQEALSFWRDVKIRFSRHNCFESGEISKLECVSNNWQIRTQKVYKEALSVVYKYLWGNFQKYSEIWREVSQKLVRYMAIGYGWCKMQCKKNLDGHHFYRVLKFPRFSPTCLVTRIAQKLKTLLKFVQF